MEYALVDSGDQKKLERFGDFLLIRPCAAALWKPLFPNQWKAAHAEFTREKGNEWIHAKPLPNSWTTKLSGIDFKIAPTDFGHLGVFPEHALLWKWMQEAIAKEKRELSVLNLFAYSGGATLAAAKAGAKVCHLDASKGMVSWARENAALNQMQNAPIRWIVDDVVKFLHREIKRNVRYDGIILDPPSFGRGNNGEVFKFERDLNSLLDLCRSVLSEKPAFVILSTHTPGMSPLVMDQLMQQMMEGTVGKIESGEMILESKNSRTVPCGSYARWYNA
jgi:23S rRNA (cytosine1962-C5)-methyltransferase